MKAVPGLLKIFDSNGSFSNLEVRPIGTIMTHKGTYKIIYKETYTESIDGARQDAYYALSGKIYSIKYTLSADKDLLTLTGSVDGKDGSAGLNYTEVWHRLAPQ